MIIKKRLLKKITALKWLTSAIYLINLSVYVEIMLASLVLMQPNHPIGSSLNHFPLLEFRAARWKTNTVHIKKLLKQLMLMG